MVLGKLQVPGRPTIWITVGQGPTALTVGAGGGCLDIFTLIYPFYPLSPSLWETARYRLKYCLKGSLSPKQPTNHPTTSLQAVAISVSLDKEITICSVYIPPNFQLQSQHLDFLLEQLSSPYLLLGDFNGHNILWGCNKNNTRGEIIS